MPTDQDPTLATRTHPIPSQKLRAPLYIELRDPTLETPQQRDRVHERQMEEPERWDGMS